MIETYLTHGVGTVFGLLAVLVVVYTLVAPVRYRHTSWDPTIWEPYYDMYGGAHDRRTPRGLALLAGDLIYLMIGVLIAVLVLGYFSHSLSTILF